MLVTAGIGALKYDVVPLTLVITAMLVLLVVSYSQVIAAHPEGGGAYSVAKANLGRWASLLAAAALVVDYVLTVAVSLAAGAASLGSVFPGLAHHLLLVSLVGLALLTAVNMFGIAESARLLLLPTRAVHRQHPRGDRGRGVPSTPGGGDRHQRSTFPVTESLGIVLLLKAFASGCSAVTGVEAISNGVPAFREPRIRTAQRTEISLGVLLGRDARRALAADRARTTSCRAAA